MTAPFYIRHPDESLGDFISRIRAAGRLPELLELRQRPTGRPTGRPNGRPRGDGVLLAMFADADQLSLQDIVERTGKPYRTVQKAVYRCKQRGLLEHDRESGLYRPVEQP